MMLGNFYRKHPYSINMLAVLILLRIIRIIDWFLWQPQYPHRTKIIFLSNFSEFVPYLLVIPILIYTYLWALKRKNTVLIVSLIIVFTIGFANLMKPLNLLFVSLVRNVDYSSLAIDNIHKYLNQSLISLIILNLTFYLTHIAFQYYKQKEATFKAEALAKDVQLKMLRYQINPHFLFNVLNSIHALIDENANNAKKLIVEMSEYYRYTLNKQQQTIPIGNEVEAIVKYLEIQKIRFEEKFEYQIAVDEAVNSLSIPSFVIHLLIENAVKHGIKSNEQKLIILLKVELINNSLLISVSNTGKLAEDLQQNNIDGTGSGIDNIKNRLALFYSDNSSFLLKEEDGWVIATIEIKNIIAS